MSWAGNVKGVSSSEAAPFIACVLGAVEASDRLRGESPPLQPQPTDPRFSRRRHVIEAFDLDRRETREFDRLRRIYRYRMPEALKMVLDARRNQGRAR